MANIDQASVFATGTASTSGLDSLTLGNGSLWAEFGNGASSTGGSGSSTLVQHNLAGTIQHNYSIDGSVDGLKVNPFHRPGLGAGQPGWQLQPAADRSRGQQRGSGARLCGEQRDQRL